MFNATTKHVLVFPLKCLPKCTFEIAIFSSILEHSKSAKGGQRRYENKTKVIFHCGISTEAKNFKP